MCCGIRICMWVTLSVAILIIAYLFNPFNPSPPDPPPPDFSYDHRIDFNLNNLHSPTSHDEIVRIIKTVHHHGQKVRVLAAGHSWSEIAQTQDVMISLHNYSGIIEVNTESLTVTVKAGTSLRDLSELLDAEGLAMINLGSVAAQSLGGAISTATHGTGLTVGNLASLVTMVKFVSGTGETVVLTEDTDSSRFRAAVVSIGMFGVLSEITIRVATAFNLKEIRSPHSMDYCLENLPTLVEGHEYVKMWVEFYNNFCALYQTEKTNEDPTGNPGRIESFLTYYTFAFATRVTYLVPSLTQLMMWLVDHVGLGSTTERVDKSYLIFNDYFELPIHQESEIIVPYSDAVKLVEKIKEVVLRDNYPVNYITEVRFISGDNNHLSPQYGMDDGSCAVTLTIYGREDTVTEYFDAVYEATRDFEGRIHWGKHFSQATHTSFRQWYPDFEEFTTFREEYDPEDIFVNDFIEEKFGFQ